MRRHPRLGSDEDGLGGFLVLAFGFGLAAIFTPCVFPMIPITMSYFVGQRGGLRQAVVFCLGIIVLFSGLGLVLTLALGPAAVVQLGSNAVGERVYRADVLRVRSESAGRV